MEEGCESLLTFTPMPRRKQTAEQPGPLTLQARQPLCQGWPVTRPASGVDIMES